MMNVAATWVQPHDRNLNNFYVSFLKTFATVKLIISLLIIDAFLS